MGKPITPKYRVESTGWGSYGWQARRRGQLAGWGKPTDSNLARHVRELEASTEPGGVNEHLGVTRIARAEIIDQATGKVVAVYRGND